MVTVFEHQPAADVMRVLDTADRLSSYNDIFANGVPLIARGAPQRHGGLTMDARLQLRVQRYGWDKAAAHYESYWSAQLRPAQDRLLQLAALSPVSACSTWRAAPAS